MKTMQAVRLATDHHYPSQGVSDSISRAIEVMRPSHPIVARELSGNDFGPVFAARRMVGDIEPYLSDLMT